MPELRFAGFAGEWEEKKLEDISLIFDGTHQTPNYTDNGIKFLSVENIKSLDSEKYISEEEFNKNFKIYPEFNDILMTRIGSIGISNIVKTNEKLAYYVTLALIKPFDSINSEFLNYSISSYSVQNDIWKKTLHVAFPNKINKNEIGKINLHTTSFLEQEKIGDLFNKIDQLIENQEKLLDQSIAFKKSMLQKMFPKKDSLVPEFRFDGFYKKWKAKKIKDFVKSLGGTSLESEFDENGNYKVINIGSYSVNNTYIDQGLRINLNKKTKNKLLNKGDLVMVLNDKTAQANILGRTLLIEEEDKFIFNQRSQKLTPLENNYPLFIFYLLNNDINRKNIIKIAQGNTQIYVNWSSVENIIYKLPDEEEQEKIGNFFKKLDKKIAKEEKLLDAYKMMKKSLLQKMFV